MAVYVHQIETLVPEASYTQRTAGARMAEWTRDKKARRYIDKIYQDSGIEQRFSVVPDLDSRNPTAFFTMGDDGFPLEPSTGRRNEIYVAESKKMYPGVAKKTLDAASGFSPKDITHVITVSCTGFYNPGPDIQIVQALGLREEVERYNIGFMGCYGAFPAMRMAEQFCRADSSAVVLVVCLEFCSLHLQLNGDLDSVVANSVFADGAAGLIISARPPAGSASLCIDSFASALVTEGEEDMAWDIGDRGFDIVLSKYVPKIIGANIDALASGVLGREGKSCSDIDYWAVHPGGKSILDKVQQGLELSDEKIASSRRILKDYGNMSSATVLFVLRDLMQNCAAQDEICALAFGPGLTVETAVFTVQLQ